MRFLLLTALLFVYISNVFGQGFHFGRNKVQYTDFDWQILQTRHFDIYYYPEMEKIAEKGARFAEEGYAYLETRFNYSINRRIPLIFYSSHLHFQQTNVSPGFIPEGVGGFFEFIKGRVVVPSNGDLKRFRRVIRHELVHVFMHGKIEHVMRSHDKLDGAYPPLWFIEGVAEFWSGGWDEQGEMVLKDAVLNNYVVGLENMYRIRGTFTMYKVGQDVIMYIADHYGEDKILALLENLWKFKHFEDCFEYVIGKDYKTFDQEYLYHLKKRYYPLLEDNDFNAIVSETIVREGYNFKPAFYSTGGKDYVVFVGNRTGYSSIYMRPLKPLKTDQEEEDVEVLVKGEATSDFEAFHVFDSKIDVNKDGLLAFTSKSGESDVLYIYDIKKRSVIQSHSFDALVGIVSPNWSPDGRSLVFSGLNKRGYQDLYILDLDDKHLRQITDDFYVDNDPVWSPDGAYIAFSSDRTLQGSEGASNIFLINQHTGEIYYLTYGPQNDEAPSFSKDGSYLAYSSDRSGSMNLYMVENPVQTIHGDRKVVIQRMTQYIGSTFDPVWTHNGGLLYGTFENRRFQIRLETNFASKREEAAADTMLLPPYQQRNYWTYPDIREKRVEARKPYVRKYNLDFAQTQLSQDPIFGTTGGAQVAFTDMLGNDQYYFLLYNNARTSSDFWESFNFAATRVSLEQRMNYAIGIYRFAGYYYNPEDFYYYEEKVGGQVSLSYPLSHFSRFVFHQNLAYSDKDWFFNKRRQAYLNATYFSYVHDNSIWGSTGPVDGQRFNITFGHTYDIAFSEVSYLTGLIDLRKYFRLSLRNTYAARLLYLFNEGKEARQFYLGGSWDLRGYDRWSLHGKNIFLLSQELRFPLIDAIGLRFPFLAMTLQGIRGALFVDAGNAWNDELTEMLGSFGLGMRMRLAGYLVLRLDMGRRTDFKSISDHTFTQFFFGWDF